MFDILRELKCSSLISILEFEGKADVLLEWDDFTQNEYRFVFYAERRTKLSDNYDDVLLKCISLCTEQLGKMVSSSVEQRLRYAMRKHLLFVLRIELDVYGYLDGVWFRSNILVEDNRDKLDDIVADIVDDSQHDVVIIP